MSIFSTYVIPFLIALIIFFGILKKINIFDCFLDGAKEGLMSTFSIAPSIIGLITAVSMLTASGALDVFSKFLSPVTSLFKIPSEVIPLMFLKPISGSGSLAIINSIFSNVGPDSFAGRIASVLMSSTETTFYAINVYFGSIRIKNIRYTVKSALLIDLIGFFVSIISVKILFSYF